MNKFQAGQIKIDNLNLSDYQKEYDVKLVTFNTQSKYVAIQSYSWVGVLEHFEWNDQTPYIELYANKNTLYYDSNDDKSTILTFPEYKGWDIIYANRIGRYTILVIFRRDKFLKRFTYWLKTLKRDIERMIKC